MRGRTFVWSMAVVAALAMIAADAQPGPTRCSDLLNELQDIAELRDKQTAAREPSERAVADATRVYDGLARATEEACGSGAPATCARIQGARDRADAIQTDVERRAKQTRLTDLQDLSLEAFHVHSTLVGLAADACRARMPVRIGHASAISGMVQAIAPDGTRRTMATGASVYLGDRLVSDTTGRLQVLLLDGTVFTLGPNSDMMMDEFIYDPATTDGKVTASLVKGLFRFVTGKIAATTPANMKVKLPVGNIGIRGTDFILTLAEAGASVSVNAGSVTFEQDTSGEVIEIPAGTTGTFSQRDAGTQPMTRGEWEGLVAAVTPVGASPSSERKPDAGPIYLLVWLALVLATMPFALARRRKRFAATAVDSAVGSTPDASAEAEAVRFCAGCGAEAMPGATFCTACGRPHDPSPVGGGGRKQDRTGSSLRDACDPSEPGDRA